MFALQMDCSFFTEKDNIGLLCITHIVLGIISGLGLMFLCNNRNKAENYESVQMPMTMNDEYLGFPTENRIQSNDFRESNRLIRRDFQRNRRSAEPVYINRRNDYLDPEFNKGESNYLKPIHYKYENTDLGRKQESHYLNTCTSNKQCTKDSLDDYLEPRT